MEPIEYFHYDFVIWGIPEELADRAAELTLPLGVKCQEAVTDTTIKVAIMKWPSSIDGQIPIIARFFIDSEDPKLPDYVSRMFFFAGKYNFILKAQGLLLEKDLGVLY